MITVRKRALAWGGFGGKYPVGTPGGSRERAREHPGKCRSAIRRWSILLTTESKMFMLSLKPFTSNENRIQELMASFQCSQTCFHLE